MYLITMTKRLTFAVLLLSVFTVLISIGHANAQYGLGNIQDDTLSKSVFIHPVIETGENQYINTREHTYRSQLRLGDQLARDFMVATTNKHGILEFYRNDGKFNEDYYGWKKNVMAPFNAKVTRVNEADSTNKPGNMNGDIRPGLIFFKKDNGLTVIYAHVRDIKVEKGDRVEAGNVVAKVGNNGNSRGPHVHVGAWKDETPLQIQVDLYAEKRNKGENKSNSK